MIFIEFYHFRFGLLSCAAAYFGYGKYASIMGPTMSQNCRINSVGVQLADFVIAPNVDKKVGDQSLRDRSNHRHTYIHCECDFRLHTDDGLPVGP